MKEEVAEEKKTEELYSSGFTTFGEAIDTFKTISILSAALSPYRSDDTFVSDFWVDPDISVQSILFQ